MHWVTPLGIGNDIQKDLKSQTWLFWTFTSYGCQYSWFSLQMTDPYGVNFIKSGRLLLLSKWFSTQNGINAYSQTRYQGGLREPYHFGFTAIMCPGRQFEFFQAENGDF